MKSDRNAFLAGLFMFCCLLLAGVVIIGIKGFPGVVVPMQTIRVRFSLHDDIAGLRTGDDVRIGGMKVGTVRSIEIDTSSPEATILVTIFLPKRYVMHPSAKVGVQSTLTGGVDLNIENLGDGPLLADGETVTGSPSPMSTIFAALQKAAPDIAAITSAVRTQTVPKVNAVADHAATAIASASALLGDTKPDFRGTLAHLNVITATIQDRLPSLADKVSADLDAARGAIVDARQTLVNARSISATARSIVVDNQSKFTAIIDALTATADNLKDGSVEIRHSPWRLLYKPGPNEMANMNLYDSARQFADGAESLNGAASALRDALKDPQTDPKQLKKLMQDLDAAFANFNQVEQKLWSAVKE
jgi:phospholipid/cholesterol/gamma-HCH transport system substrate-binding protein